VIGPVPNGTVCAGNQVFLRPFVRADVEIGITRNIDEVADGICSFLAMAVALDQH